MKKKKKIIKEILNLLEEYPHLFSDGLCTFVIRLKNVKIISADECEEYRYF